MPVYIYVAERQREDWERRENDFFMTHTITQSHKQLHNIIRTPCTYHATYILVMWQLAEATRQIEGLRNIFRKMTQHDLHRAFRHLRLTLDASRQNRFKLRKIVMKMKNLKLKAAFQGFVEVVIDIQAKVYG